MKTVHFIFTLATIVLSSCTNAPKNNEPVIIPTNMNEPVSCYSYTKDSNRVMMHISIVDNKVSGDLKFEYYQKDKNNGKITGEMKGDTMLADYTFWSEGIQSTREVAFLKKGNEWKEGYGDVEEQFGKMVFKSRAALDFENSVVLKKTECSIDEH